VVSFRPCSEYSPLYTWRKMRLNAIPLPSRNIVATVNLDCRLDLKTIALHARNAEYNPKVLLALPLVAQSSLDETLAYMNIIYSVSLLSSCAFVNPRLLR
jgi:hypothetical protein